MRKRGALPPGRLCVTGTVTQQDRQGSPSSGVPVIVLLAFHSFFPDGLSPRTAAGPEAGGEGVQEGQRHPGSERECGAADSAPAGLRRPGDPPEQRRAAPGEGESQQKQEGSLEYNTVQENPTNEKKKSHPRRRHGVPSSGSASFGGRVLDILTKHFSHIVTYRLLVMARICTSAVRR